MSSLAPSPESSKLPRLLVSPRWNSAFDAGGAAAYGRSSHHVASRNRAAHDCFRTKPAAGSSPPVLSRTSCPRPGGVKTVPHLGIEGAGLSSDLAAPGRPSKRWEEVGKHRRPPRLFSDGLQSTTAGCRSAPPRRI